MIDPHVESVILEGNAAGLGYLPDPAKQPGEKPDFDVADLPMRTDVVPESYSQRHLVRDVLDQGPIGSCVANAGFQACRMNHVSQGFERAVLGDRIVGYYLARAYIFMTQADSGSHLRDFFRALNKFGFLAEVDYDPTTFKEPPTPGEMRKAFDQRMPTVYRRITATGEARVLDIKRALANDYQVVFGTAIERDFLRADGQSVIEAPDPGNEMGGHAMCASGYSRDGLEVVNSWSDRWGDGGFATLSWDYIKDVRSRDFWVVESSPYYSEIS